MTPSMDLTEVVAKLEKENRALTTRMDKLERQKGSFITALMANVILLLTAALMADYLGFLPRFVDRLPLQAKTVEAEEILIRLKDGAPQARLLADTKGFRFLDANGKSLLPKP